MSPLTPLVIVLVVALVAALVVIASGVVMERRSARHVQALRAGRTAAVARQRGTTAESGAHGDERAVRREVSLVPHGQQYVQYDIVVPRGTRSAVLADHAEEWRAAMRDVGARLRQNVAAIVFTHGSFVGSDPFSALAAAQRLRFTKPLAQALRERMHASIGRVLGDLGNFGTGYVKLFEEALGGELPCHSFVWSSENHHLGRLEGALRLVGELARHAERAPPKARLLVVGHSHAGQVFALVTRLLAGSVIQSALEAVARARSLDISSLEKDVGVLAKRGLDFVTFGAPSRYAWGDAPAVRSLHVVHGRPEGAGLRLAADDWVRRLGAAGTDFPAIAAEERRVNAELDLALGPGFAPTALLRALRGAPAPPLHGELVIVDYGERLTGFLKSGLGHGLYTRFDAMLFHASLVASRLYARPRA